MKSQLMNNISIVEENSSLVQQHEHNNENEENDNKIRPWADLPSELLELIYSGLSVPGHISCSSIRDQIQFRLTCKTWQLDCVLGQFPVLMSRNQKKYFTFFNPITSKEIQDDPKESGGGFTFFNPITNKEIQVYDDDGMEFEREDHIHCSKFGGWLLISRRFNLFFYNPFIPGSATIKLPLLRVGFVQRIDSMSFTAPPTSSECIVYVHDVYNSKTGSSKEVVIYRWCYGEDHWTDYRIRCQLPFGQSYGNPILYKSVFYQLNERGRLGISDPRKGNEQHIWKDLPRPKPVKIRPPNTKKRKQQLAEAEDPYHTRNYMAECDGRIVMVHVEYIDLFLVLSVHVFELDWSRMEWVTVQSLGNKAMFICEAESLLIKTNGGGVENKIYFPAFVETTDDGVVCFAKRAIGGDGRRPTKKVGVFYCLENHTYNYPPEYWDTVTRCTWFDTKFQLV